MWASGLKDGSSLQMVLFEEECKTKTKLWQALALWESYFSKSGKDEADSGSVQGETDKFIQSEKGQCGRNEGWREKREHGRRRDEELCMSL